MSGMENGAQLPDRIPAGAGASSVADAIDLTLEAYLGDARLTLASLKALKGGSLLELEAPLNALVELRLNGVCVAEGELVAVGDNFGVRISKIAADA